MFFLPQRPYMILGSLRAQLLYPALHHPMSEVALQHMLELTGEGHWRLLPVETYVLETSAASP